MMLMMMIIMIIHLLETWMWYQQYSAIKCRFISTTVLNTCSETAFQPEVQLTAMEKKQVSYVDKSGENITKDFKCMPLQLTAILR